MKKSIKILCIAFVIFGFSCSKKEDPKPAFQEENFLQGYLTATGFNEQTSTNSYLDTYDFGLEFTPLVTGAITSLHVKLPVAANAVQIIIWDKENGIILKTETIDVTVVDKVFSKTIANIPLTKGKFYAITVRSKDVYFRSKTSSGSAIYPVTISNIKITDNIAKLATSSGYPPPLGYFNYLGDASFNFIQTQ